MFNNKKCTRCGQPATTKITRRENGEFEDIYLCDDHASQESKYQKPTIQLSDILQSILKQEVGAKPGEDGDPPSGLLCSQCGLSYDIYRLNLILGCSECYESFREYLTIDLRRFHGEIRHSGRHPGGGLQGPLAEEPVPAVENTAAESPVKHPFLDTLAAAIPSSELVGMKEEDYQRKKRRLERSLAKSIQAQGFLEAAKLRDRLRELDQRYQEQNRSDESP
jgi:protein arginine kinase activator